MPGAFSHGGNARIKLQGIKWAGNTGINKSDTNRL
jgi:hypothetical protein